jgi:Na+/H+-dicarboxylate symporter
MLILLCLVAGLIAGMTTGDHSTAALAGAKLVGGIWLNALRMTVVPLVVALLITGIGQTARVAQAGRLAGRSVAMMIGLLWLSSALGAALVLLFLRVFPVPAQAPAIAAGPAEATQPPALMDFLQTIVPTNPFAAAANDAMLPLILFTMLFAFATLRLPEEQQTRILALFEAIAGAMIVMIGWVLWLAPVGVFALGYGLGHSVGAAAFGSLAHYVAILVATGGVIWVGAVLLAMSGAKISPLLFLRAATPAQAVAISTQSSLASLPAMLTGLDELGTRRRVSEVILPVAVAIFRVTSPAFNLGVALYIARWTGVELGMGQIALGVVIAALTTLGSVSLPGSVSFIGSIAPICLAIGVPVAPLGLLVAIEALPDLMRTLANVTMDMALTATIDRRWGEE